MNANVKWIVLVILIGFLSFNFRWTKGAGIVSEPRVYLISEYSFPVSPVEIEKSIKLAFNSNQYRGMNLCGPERLGELFPEIGDTNGYLLYRWDRPIGNVYIGPKSEMKVLPYDAYYYITMNPNGRNKTKVIINTIRSKVIDGKKLSIYNLGYVNRYVDTAPSTQIEYEILLKIAENVFGDDELKNKSD